MSGQPDPAQLPEPPSAGRRERQRLETRERLFEAALAEFREAGFARAQIDRIVERAGVARGTFYFHFPTKEHVLLELQKRAERDLTRRMAESVQGARSLREYLRGTVDAILVEDTTFEPELQRELLAMYVRHPEPAYLAAADDPLLQEMVDAFQEAAERGEIRSDLSPEELVGTFMRALFGWVAIRAIEPLPGQRTVDTFIDIFVRGVSP